MPEAIAFFFLFSTDPEKTSYLLFIFFFFVIFPTWRYNRLILIASYTFVMYPILNMYAEIKRDAAD